MGKLGGKMGSFTFHDGRPLWGRTEIHYFILFFIPGTETDRIRREHQVKERLQRWRQSGSPGQTVTNTNGKVNSLCQLELQAPWCRVVNVMPPRIDSLQGSLSICQDIINATTESASPPASRQPASQPASLVSDSNGNRISSNRVKSLWHSYFNTQMNVISDNVPRLLRNYWQWNRTRRHRRSKSNVSIGFPRNIFHLIFPPTSILYREIFKTEKMRIIGICNFCPTQSSKKLNPAQIINKSKWTDIAE